MNFQGTTTCEGVMESNVEIPCWEMQVTCGKSENEKDRSPRLAREGKCRWE